MTLMAVLFSLVKMEGIFFDVFSLNFMTDNTTLDDRSDEFFSLDQPVG